MKKIFAILTIGAALIACNNSTEESTKTTTNDSIQAESPLGDAVKTADSANKIMHDSAKRVMDSLKK